jgi:hypothetical protein
MAKCVHNWNLLRKSIELDEDDEGYEVLEFYCSKCLKLKEVKDTN